MFIRFVAPSPSDWLGQLSLLELATLALLLAGPPRKEDLQERLVRALRAVRDSPLVSSGDAYEECEGSYAAARARERAEEDLWDVDPDASELAGAMQAVLRGEVAGARERLRKILDLSPGPACGPMSGAYAKPDREW